MLKAYGRVGTVAARLVVPGVVMALLLAAAAPGAATTAQARSAEATLPWGVPSPAPVLSAPGTPLSDIMRDCGFSVELTNGDALWIFCDSTDAVPGGDTLTYFVNNTAALALRSSPLVMRDVPDSQGSPHRFITPTVAYAPCSPDERHVIWPLSAARVDGPGGTDRVLVYYHNICQHRTTFVRRDMATGVARWDHDPALPQTQRITTPAQATIVQPALFANGGTFPTWGHSAVNGADGYVYVNACKLGGCALARVPSAEVGTIGSYRFWDGATWALTVPETVEVAYATTARPYANPQTVWIPEMGLFAQVDRGSPQSVWLWFSARPEGPWGAPTTVPFPDCANGPWFCYHATVHSQLSGIDVVGVGFHDSRLSVNGQIRAVTRVSQVPVDLEPAPAGTCRTPFSDVRTANPFCAQILWAATAGITTGHADDTFRPLSPASRQAMSAFLWRLAGEPLVEIPEPSAQFNDVDANHPFAAAIYWMAAEQITTGYPDGSFRPTLQVSRQATAAWLWRLAGSPAPPGDAPSFTDVVAGHPFGEAIAWMAGTGISTGYPDQTFRPGIDISRQAITAFLARFDALD